MAIERWYPSVGPVAFTQDGGNDGIVVVTDTSLFKVKMIVVVQANSLPITRFEIKKVISPTEMVLGPEDKPITARSDMSAYILGLNPTVEAFEQERPKIPPADYERAVYEEEPVVAKRSYLVDRYGSPYTISNPFPVSLAGSVELSVDLNRPNTQSFAKVAIALKAVEVSFTFPNNTKYYRVKVRDHKDVVKIGLAPGAIAAGDFWTLNFGCEESPRELVDFANGYTLYFESKHKDNVDLEILYYVET
jgi:hypothetical protein